MNIAVWRMVAVGAILTFIGIDFILFGENGTAGIVVGGLMIVIGVAIVWWEFYRKTRYHQKIKNSD
jgi:drug/metabolite transporter (DMT)-like permease